MSTIGFLGWLTMVCSMHWKNLICHQKRLVIPESLVLIKCMFLERSFRRCLLQNPAAMQKQLRLYMFIRLDKVAAGLHSGLLVVSGVYCFIWTGTETCNSPILSPRFSWRALRFAGGFPVICKSAKSFGQCSTRLSWRILHYAFSYLAFFKSIEKSYIGWFPSNTNSSIWQFQESDSKGAMEWPSWGLCNPMSTGLRWPWNWSFSNVYSAADRNYCASLSMTCIAPRLKLQRRSDKKMRSCLEKSCIGFPIFCVISNSFHISCCLSSTALRKIQILCHRRAIGTLVGNSLLVPDLVWDN